MWCQETFRIASHGRYSIGEMIGKVHTDRSVFGRFPPFFASKSLCCMEDWWKNVVFIFHPQQKHRSVTMDLRTMEFCWIFLDVVSLSFLHNSEGHLCHRLQWTLSHYRAVCGHQKDCHQQLRNCGKNGETYWWKYIEMHCRICSLACKYSPSWNPNAIRLKTCDGSQVEITIHSCRQTELECVSDIFRTQQLERGIMRPTILEPGTIKRYVWTEGFWKNGVRSPHPVEEGVPATALREMSLLRDWVFLVSLNGAEGRLNRVIWGSRKKETSPTRTMMSKGAISGTLWVLLGSEEVPSTHTSYVSMM